MTGYRDVPPLSERCRGKWPGILAALGVPPALFDRKHHPCPFCGGTDRFRFTDFAGAGVWICGQAY
jgi:putative DNA primase/helicase